MKNKLILLGLFMVGILLLVIITILDNSTYVDTRIVDCFVTVGMSFAVSGLFGFMTLMCRDESENNDEKDTAEKDTAEKDNIEGDNDEK